MDNAERIAKALATKVRKTRAGCLEWEGSMGGSRNAYGLITLGRTSKVYAHRAAYELHYGRLPEGLSVLHRCDNPRCVRPEHLFAGTQTDNMADMATKQRARAPQGSAHHDAVLTEAAVRNIRASTLSASALAAAFGVTYQTVWAARNRITWRHVA